jgi:hypothetical protein
VGPSQSSGGGGRGVGRLEKVASYKPRSKQEREKEDWKRRERERVEESEEGRKEKRVYSQALLYLSPHYTPFEHKDSSQEGQQGK